MLKRLKSKKVIAAACVLVAALSIPGIALANSSSYNLKLAGSGLHTTLCQTTKGNSSTKVKNSCTDFTNHDSGWSWTWWVDNTTTGKQATSTQVIGSVGSFNKTYSSQPSVGHTVKGRGSTNGLLSSSMTVKGTINFDA